MHYKFSMTLQRSGWENCAYTWEAVPFPRYVTGTIYGEMRTEPIVLPAHMPVCDNMIDHVAALMRETINDRETWPEGTAFIELLESKGIASYDKAIEAMAVSLDIPSPFKYSTTFTLTHMIYWLMSRSSDRLQFFSHDDFHNIGLGAAMKLFPDGQPSRRMNPAEIALMAMECSDGKTAIVLNEIAYAHWNLMEDLTPSYHIANDGWLTGRKKEVRNERH